MDAIKAGLEKTLEAVNTKTVNEKLEKAADPNVKPSERMDAEFEANQAAAKATQNQAKAEEKWMLERMSGEYEANKAEAKDAEHDKDGHKIKHVDN